MMLALLYMGAYLLGSVPFAVVLGRLKHVDVLKAGSGNPGMTNVWRISPALGAACFVLDVCKSLFPTLLARWLIPNPMEPLDAQSIWFSVGIAAVVGHCASVFLKFRGGKGVSTALGVVLGASPLVGLSCFGLFFVVLLMTRYVSLASVVGLASASVFVLVVPGQTLQMIPVFVLLTLFVTYRHRKNFQRILAGAEPKIRLPWLKK